MAKVRGAPSDAMRHALGALRLVPCPSRFHPRIQDIPQAVPRQVQAQHCDGDGQAGDVVLLHLLRSRRWLQI